MVYFTARKAAQILDTTPVTLARWREINTGPEWQKDDSDQVVYSDESLRIYIEREHQRQNARADYLLKSLDFAVENQSAGA
jgi:DNA-binding transcriptional MerR regulator